MIELWVGRSRMRDQVGLVDLALPSEERREHGNADAAAQVADEVRDAGDLVAHVARDAHVTEDADGDEYKRESGHLVHAPEDHGAEIDGEAKVGDVIEGHRSDAKAE